MKSFRVSMVPATMATSAEPANIKWPAVVRVSRLDLYPRSTAELTLDTPNHVTARDGLSDEILGAPRDSCPLRIALHPLFSAFPHTALVFGTVVVLPLVLKNAFTMFRVMLTATCDSASAMLLVHGNRAWSASIGSFSGATRRLEGVHDTGATALWARRGNRQIGRSILPGHQAHSLVSAPGDWRRAGALCVLQFYHTHSKETAA